MRSVLLLTSCCIGASYGQLRNAPLPAASQSSDVLGLMHKVEAKNDADWGAEAFADKAGAVLKQLAHAMESREWTEISAANSDARFGPLRPASLHQVFKDASLTVHRGDVPTAKSLDLKAALLTLLAAFPEKSEVHSKFKIVGVELDAAKDSATTKAYLQCSAATPTGIAQVSATWDCVWKIAEVPVLTSIAVTEYEEIQPAAKPTLFQDAAPAVLGETQAWKSFLTVGLDHWFKQVDGAFQIAQGYHGVSVRDVDGDEREDVFLCQPAGIHNMLMKRLPDGTLTDHSASSGLDFLDNTRSALFVDLDNDGDADAAITLGYEVILFENDGKGHFTKKTSVDMASWIMSMTAADYDNDGRLDLYFCGYSPRDTLASGDLLANPIPYHDANNGAQNFLIHNEGSFKFTNATSSTGMDVNNRKFTNAAAWEDYDNDGDMDLYCANDFGRKNLYRNDLIKDGKRSATASFVDIATETGVSDIGAGMSAAWADYDQDGNMDLYVANMFSSAGRRIASQKNFKAQDSAEDRAGLLRLARGNSLFKNNGNHTFTDLGDSSGTFLGRWAWASLFVDLNNDSWQDLYVCNGFYTRPDPADL